jgi:energy-coupling factor transporter transmembrane protein EcfT
MDYRIRYFLFLTLVITMFFFSAMIFSIFYEIITTKILSVEISSADFFIMVRGFIGILLFSFIVSAFYIPFVAKPTSFLFNVENSNHEAYVLSEIDNYITNYDKSNAKRSQKRTEGNVTSYATGKKLIDWLVTPLAISKENGVLLITGPRHYIAGIKNLKLYKNSGA